MLGLILEGGAMRAWFVAGALMAFMDRNLVHYPTNPAASLTLSPKKTDS